jgi:flagellar FliL protein
MSEGNQIVSTPPAANRQGLMTIIVVGVIAATFAMVGAGGLVFWLSKTGRMPVPTTSVKGEAAPRVVPRTHLAVLEPLLVNLADDDGHCYLRVAMTLRIEEGPIEKAAKGAEESGAKGKPVNAFEAAERDAALTVIGRDTSANLLASDGKEQLKQQLRSALALKVPEIRIADVLFTEFLVQR